MISVVLGLLMTQKLGTPLERAFAHNDYAHTRPLADALENGFTYVEADVFLVDGKILVAHDLKDAKPGRGLENLYLKPLLQIHQSGKGPIYPGYSKPFWLMIDIKTDGAKVYVELERLLKGYERMLCKWTDAGMKPGAVAIVLSGDRPVSMVAAQKERYVAIDGRPDDLENNPPVGLVPWISSSFGDFKFDPEKEPTDELRQKMKSVIERVHAQKRQVRFWGIPDTPSFWKLQKELGMDMINTDRLQDLRAWLLGTGTIRRLTPGFLHPNHRHASNPRRLKPLHRQAIRHLRRPAG